MLWFVFGLLVGIVAVTVVVKKFHDRLAKVEAALETAKSDIMKIVRKVGA